MPDTPIGTNSPDYILVTADLGADIYCKVTATNASGSANADSNTVGPVAAAPSTGSTWNPADLFETTDSQLDFSGGNLTVTGRVGPTPDNVPCGVRGTLSHNTGKYYFEITLNVIPTNDGQFGLATSTAVLSNPPPGVTDAHGFGFRIYVGVETGYSAIAYDSGTSYTFTAPINVTVGNVFGFAVDFSTKTIWFRHNGAWLEGDPTTPTGGLTWVTTPTTLFPHFTVTPVHLTTEGSVTLNTGATAFAHTIPTGFTAWG